MDQNQQVDVSTLLGSVASMLGQNQAGINGVDAGGTHGARMAQAFKVAADAAGQAGTDDAGQQLRVAAQAMRQHGQGKAAGFYANGLEEASSQFQGQRGLAMSDLLPFLQSRAGGVQKGNPAQPGQGTMIDAILPAVSGFMSAKQQGMDPTQAAIHAVGSAVTGARNTGGNGQMDPGAASATSVIGGLVSAFLPGIIGSLMHGGRGQSATQAQQPQAQGQDPLGGLGGLGGLLGGLMGGQGGSQGGLGGLLGGQGGSQQGGLGGLFGGQGGSEGGLGGLLGGLGGSEGEPGGQAGGPGEFVPGLGGLEKQ